MVPAARCLGPIFCSLVAVLLLSNCVWAAGELYGLDDYEEPTERPWGGSSRSSATPAVSFQLAGGRACLGLGPAPSGKPEKTDKLYLGFNNGSCWSSGANLVGPVIRAQKRSIGWRQWKMSSGRNNTKKLFTHSMPGHRGAKGKCTGFLVVEKSGVCADKRAHVHAKGQPIPLGADEWQLVPVPNRPGRVYIIAGGRTKGCARYLSASATCADPSITLAVADDASGRQHWRVKSITSSGGSQGGSTGSNTVPQPAAGGSSRSAPSLEAVLVSPGTLTVALQPGSGDFLEFIITLTPIGGGSPITLTVPGPIKNSVLTLKDLNIPEGDFLLSVVGVTSEGPTTPSPPMTISVPNSNSGAVSIFTPLVDPADVSPSSPAAYV